MAGTTEEITARAVVQYAETLRATADRREASDPFARGYRPSQALAYKLAAQLGPALALDELRRRAVAFDLDVRAERELAERAEARLSRRRRQEDAERRERLSRVSLGRRLDDVLAALKTVAEAPTPRLDGDPVSGGESERIGPWAAEDVHGDAHGRARRLVTDLEDQLESARRRPVRGAAS